MSVVEDGLKKVSFRITTRIIIPRTIGNQDELNNRMKEISVVIYK